MDETRDRDLCLTRWVSDLARGHTGFLAGVARTEGLGGEDALEAVQQGFVTFLTLPRVRDLVGAPDDTHALMTVLVRNAARNIRRRERRWRIHVRSDENDLPDESLPSVDALMAKAEQHARLHGCVDRLATVQRHVVTMRMLEEASGADVAARLALAPGHVAVLLHRAKKELLRCLTE